MPRDSPLPRYHRHQAAPYQPWRRIARQAAEGVAAGIRGYGPNTATLAASMGSYLFNAWYPSQTPPSSGESTRVTWQDTPPQSGLTFPVSSGAPPARKRLRFGSDPVIPSTPSQVPGGSSQTVVLSNSTPRSQNLSPHWLRFSHTPSPVNSEWGLSTQSRLVHRWRKRSQPSQQRHLFYLKRFVTNQKLRFLLRRRARLRPPRHYLSTAVRQAARRVRYRRKKYLFVRPYQRKQARLLVQQAKKSLWLAKRRYRNAPF